MTSEEPRVQRVAVVTGANRGLGSAITMALAQQGLHVVAASRSESAAQALADEATSAGLSMSTHALDVTDPVSVMRLMADVGHQHGRLDVLVNNAAVAADRGIPAHQADMEIVEATLNTNLLGAWRCAKAAITEMRRHQYGRIVFVTSHMGTFGRLADPVTAAGSPAYRVSKAAVNALTCTLAADVAADRILVNAASPGMVDTRMAYGKAEESPAEAVDTFTWLATLPDDGPTGGLFHRRKRLSW